MTKHMEGVKVRFFFPRLSMLNILLLFPNKYVFYCIPKVLFNAIVCESNVPIVALKMWFPDHMKITRVLETCKFLCLNQIIGITGCKWDC